MRSGLTISTHRRQMGSRVPVRGSWKLGTHSGLWEKLRPQQKQALVRKAYPILAEILQMNPKPASMFAASRPSCKTDARC